MSKNYDHKNVFVNSYTIQIHISEEQNRLFDNSFFRHDKEEPRGE